MEHRDGDAVGGRGINAPEPCRTGWRQLVIRDRARRSAAPPGPDTLPPEPDKDEDQGQAKDADPERHEATIGLLTTRRAPAHRARTRRR